MYIAFNGILSKCRQMIRYYTMSYLIVDYTIYGEGTYHRIVLKVTQYDNMKFVCNRTWH